jgi:RNA polymerase sigma-70 factor (ECF subfamily)
LGRQEFITTVYNRYGKRLYSYAVTHWNLNEDTAWNLIYKTIYKVADTIDNYQFESEEKFASFIFRILINYLRNHYRDSKKERVVEFSAMEDVDLSAKIEEEDLVPENKNLKALNEVLDEMEDWERVLLLMRSQGQAYSEIANYLDKPENQLKVYYQRLKEKLAKKLNERNTR